MASNLVHSALATHTRVFPVLTAAQINRIRPFASLRLAALGALRSEELMILRIERIPELHKVRLRLSGQFRSHHLDQVKAEISRGEPIALDLEDVDLVDIEAIRFLNAREDEGISVLHCSPYIQEWMSRERQEEKTRTDWR